MNAAAASSPPDRPRQAVILAGGRGTRLGALTATRPKPMVEFHGRPFLEYLITQLRDQGFQRILLLLGYLPEVIVRHFGDGARWGVTIDYSVTDPDDLTSRRVQVAADRLDQQFLLLYCDNYWPMRFDRMWQRFRARGLPAMVTVYTNEDGYTRDSVRVGDDDRMLIFDRSRTTPGLRGVEISYAVLDRAVLDLLPPFQQLFEEAVYPELTRQGNLLAWRTDHRYYSVGSPKRLAMTDRFLAREPAILLDRDGVLNEKPPRARYVRSRREFHWLPGAREALRALHDAGYRTLVVSNQAGVARQAMTASQLADLHAWMLREVTASGGRIDAIYTCCHDWDAGCSCRKPKPGMLFQAQRDFCLDLTRTTFVGDDERDAEAADAAGARFERVLPDRSLTDIVHQLLLTERREIA